MYYLSWTYSLDLDHSKCNSQTKTFLAFMITKNFLILLRIFLFLPTNSRPKSWIRSITAYVKIKKFFVIKTSKAIFLGGGLGVCSLLCLSKDLPPLSR